MEIFKVENANDSAAGRLVSRFVIGRPAGAGDAYKRVCVPGRDTSAFQRSDHRINAGASGSPSLERTREEG